VLSHSIVGWIFRQAFSVDEGVGLSKETNIIYLVLISVDSSVHLHKLSASSEVGHLDLVRACGIQELLFLKLKPLQDSLLSFKLHFGYVCFLLFQ